jgi:hypothetical protein
MHKNSKLIFKLADDVSIFKFTHVMLIFKFSDVLLILRFTNVALYFGYNACLADACSFQISSLFLSKFWIYSCSTNSNLLMLYCISTAVYACSIIFQIDSCSTNMYQIQTDVDCIFSRSACLAGALRAWTSTSKSWLSLDRLATVCAGFVAVACMCIYMFIYRSRCQVHGLGSAWAG